MFKQRLQEPVSFVQDVAVNVSQALRLYCHSTIEIPPKNLDKGLGNPHLTWPARQLDPTVNHLMSKCRVDCLQRVASSNILLVSHGEINRPSDRLKSPAGIDIAIVSPQWARPFDSVQNDDRDRHLSRGELGLFGRRSELIINVDWPNPPRRIARFVGVVLPTPSYAGEVGSP